MSHEEKAAQLLSQWLEGETDGPPPDLDDDVVEAMAVLRPDLAPVPDLDLDGIFNEVMGGDAATASAAAPSADDPGADDALVPEPANTTRWWLMGGGSLAVAAAALLSVGVALNGGNGAFESDKASSLAQPTTGDAASRPDPSDASSVADAGEVDEPERSKADADATPERQQAQGKGRAELADTRSGAADSPADLTIEKAAPAKAAARARPAAETTGAHRPEAPNTVVQGVLADRRAAVATCYNDAAGRDPMLSGAVEVEWAVVNGRTAYATATRDSTGDAELKRCLVDMIRALQWPAGADGEWSERWSFTAAGEPVDALRAPKMPAMDALNDDVLLESSEAAE